MILEMWLLLWMFFSIQCDFYQSEYEKDISLKHIGFPDDWEERIGNS